MKKLLVFSALFLAGLPVIAQAGGGTPADANQQKARAELNAMVQAMGGERWLSLQNSYIQGRTSGFYQGKPTGAITDYFQYRTITGPGAGQERVEYTKKRDAVDIYTGDDCWEATYRGKKALPKDICDDYLRRRAHSVDVAVRVWLKDPNTILINEGQTLSERHLTDQVTLIAPSNESITIQMDAETHLPRSRSFQWRDPIYHDKNTEREEYDDYHVFDGIPTAFSITRFHNGEMTSQRFLYKAAYNVALPPDAFNIDAAVAKVKK